MIFRMDDEAFHDAFEMDDLEEWKEKHDVEEVDYKEWKEKYALDSRKEKRSSWW